MIQFNLLPDVKLEYIRAMYRRRIIVLFSVVVSVVFFVIFVLLFLFVKVNQTRHLGHLDRDIDKQVSILKEKQDFDKVLTIQNQLASLPELHNKKVFGSRLFDYLTQMTPVDASIGGVTVDFETKAMTINGVAKDIITVNTFVDTLKFTNYKIAGETPREGKAFSSVVLQSFSLGGQTASKENGASYSIVFNFDEALFANTAHEGKAVTNDVSLIVPKITTTRSKTEQPKSLFQQGTPSPTGGTQ